APTVSVTSTASRMNLAKSLSATHSFKSGGKSIAVCRSIFTKRVAITLLLAEKAEVRQTPTAGAVTRNGLWRLASGLSELSPYEQKPEALRSDGVNCRYLRLALEFEWQT